MNDHFLLFVYITKVINKKKLTRELHKIKFEQSRQTLKDGAKLKRDNGREMSRPQLEYEFK